MSSWYKLAAWRRRRLGQLAREPLCRMCLELGITTAASEVDHVIPHRGDRDLFFRGEVQSLCKHHHDSAKQGDEVRGYSTAVGADGWPKDPSHPANRGCEG